MFRSLQTLRGRISNAAAFYSNSYSSQSVIVRSASTSRDSGVNDAIPRSDERKLHVNLLPIWKGQRKQGVRYGPAILNAMAHELSNSENIVTNYYENDPLNEIDGASEEDYTSHMNQFSQKLLANLSDLKPGDTVLNLGGDHSVSMATVPKMFQLHPDLRVLWIDAHADINTPTTTESGNFHGMPVYYISDLSSMDRSTCQISLENIAYIGLRDVDVAEKEVLKEHKVTCYSKDELVRRGTSAIIKDLVEKKQLMEHPLHVSFDVDSVDPAECPSTGTPVPDGLSTAHVVEMIRQLKDVANVVSIDIVEFNPLIGNDSDVDKTVQSIMKVMKEIVR